HLTYLIAQDLSYIDDPVQPEDIKVLDNCMGSGHCLVYAFDVLMLIYTSIGYSERDAASSILNNNLYGLDIDKRAFQLAYFSIMMKSRQYNKGIYNDVTNLHIYEITESNELEDSNIITFREHLNPDLKAEFTHLIELFTNAKSTGSLIQVDDLAIEELRLQVDKVLTYDRQSFAGLNLTNSLKKIVNILNVAEVLQSKYQVVVTNPPYLNKFEPSLKSFLKAIYKDYSRDLFATFIFRNFQLCTRNGFSAYMTPNVWMFIKSYEQLRRYILGVNAIDTLILIAPGAYYSEATVDVMTFVLKNNRSSKFADFIKLTDFKGDMNLQKEKVLDAIHDPDCGYYYNISHESFHQIPGNQISFWAPKSILEAFVSGTPMQKLCNPKVGLQTGDNDRFLRLWWEVDTSCIGLNTKSIKETKNAICKWYPYNKGGERRQWYGNYDYVVNWENDGVEIRNFKDSRGKLRSRPQNTYTYFQESITWSDITSGIFSIRYRESGSIHDVTGMSAFTKNNSVLIYSLGLLSTKVANYIFKILNPTLHLQVGDFANFPVLVDDNHINNVITISNACTSVSKEEWDSYETSWNFKVHPLVQRYVDLRTAYNKWATVASDRFKLVQENENKLNSIFITLYGLTDELDPFVDDQDITLRHAHKEEDIRSLISFAVGCMFGRYSLDEEVLIYAGGEWDSSKYQTFMRDADGVLPITEEAYFENDITSCFVDFIKAVYGQETLEENLNFIADALGGKDDESRAVIRNYFLTDFFRDHCKTYSVHGSGKRPIYWLYDSGKQNGFKALIYMHRYNDQTHATVRVKYLHELQKKYRSSIDSLENEINRTTNAHTKKTAEDRLNKISKQLDECTEYDEMLGHIANERISIDLDDGFKVNYEKVQTDRNGKCWPILAKIR
ncbi:MAG: BREX-1 system adenine-specific DNA-methyltransferase PglX, partial [Fastidiosipila sp.]|nr:BREX-1 system adenine-specific DNA-methyltransferase PglX [Fastidiosipila sp.]